MLRPLMATFRFDSPLGALIISLDDSDVRSLVIDDGAGVAHPELGPGPVRSALEAYFSGELSALDKVRVVATGGEQTRRTHVALRAIPAGATLSYTELAIALGRPKGARAVAQACAKNPVAVIIPCHRVIGSDGMLRGYAYGLERKRWLLDHERRHAARRGERRGAYRSEDSSSIAHVPLD